MHFTKKLVLILIIFCLFSSCKRYDLEEKVFEIQKTDGSIVSVLAEIAVTDEEQGYGYMNRKRIPEGTGMLFLFEKDKIARFWMKDTPSPLSIAYIDYKGRIRDIIDMTPFSLSEVVSSVAVRYALEVPQGWFEKTGITEGDTFISILPKYDEELALKKMESTF